MSCNCIKHGKQLWENIKRIMGHKCDYVQVGVWTDKAICLQADKRMQGLQR